MSRKADMPSATKRRGMKAKQNERAPIVFLVEEGVEWVEVVNSSGGSDELKKFVNATSWFRMWSPQTRAISKRRKERGREERRRRRNGNSCGDTGDTGYIPSHIINPIPQSSIIALNTRTRLSGLRVL